MCKQGFETTSDVNQPNTIAIEDKLFEAMEKVTLIKERRGIENTMNYAKAGRTDAGVSAIAQVISIKIRKLTNDIKGYAAILNSSLPPDIRVLDCVEVPEEFDARFDCLSREYMYFFMRRNMDVHKMNEACKYMIGSHDFRNFCRQNVIQNEIWIRQIIDAGIYPADSLYFGDKGYPGMKTAAKHLDGISIPEPEDRPPLKDGGPFDMFYLRVRASGFLWNQVDSNNFRFVAS